MRSKNPELMKKICTFAEEYYCDKRSSPSANEIAMAVGVSKATAYRYLVDMKNHNIIEYEKGVISTDKTERCKTRYFSAPIVGSVKCGDPENEEEYIEEYVSLPESIFGSGNFYILRASGDSMVDMGIEDNDLVVIKKQSFAEAGDVVVALDENNENTLKTFAGIDESTGEVILRYENRSKYPGKEIRIKELTVQGVAKHIIKSL